MKFRKMAALFAALVLCFLFSFSASGAMLGDADCDGEISASDARLALRVSVGLETVNLEQLAAADVDYDGAVTAADARSILRTSVGLEAIHTHQYQEIAREGTLKSKATCTSAAVYYKSCVCGEMLTGETDTFTNGTPAAHDYEIVNETSATCVAAASVTYRCVCGDEYTETVGAALGHSTSGVTPVEKAVDGKACEFVLVYKCNRDGCGADVNGETVYHHNYVSSITKPATCCEDGVKTLTCSACGDTETEAIAKDETGHNWVKGEQADGMRTDTCSYCAQEKKVAVFDGTSTGETKAEDLKDTEIEINDANIRFDDGAVESIGDKDITISAEKVEGDARADLGLSEDELAQIGDNPVYDFTVNDGSENISQFGEDNWITITLAYELAEGEDVDSIAVWFINDDGSLESIAAVYNNGFVTFKTNHFSYYTVTRLTPAERCALYGHSYVTQVQEGSCLLDAYTLYTCVRCHKSEKEITATAPGHNYTEDSSHAATCTENGYLLYTCKNCSHSYRTASKASGHEWVIEESVESTCLVNGYVRYGCVNCDEEYTITSEKDHEFKNETTTKLPTCTEDGVRTSYCECGTTKETVIPATGEHDYANGVCVNCGAVEVACDHTVLHQETIDLSTYGTCGGTMVFEICECGDVRFVDEKNINIYCEIVEDSVFYPGKGGKSVESELLYSMDGHCVNCGMLVSLREEAVHEDCVYTLMGYYTMSINDVAIVENAAAILEQYESHNTEYEDIDLSDYAACGGTLEVGYCMDCDEVVEFYFDDLQCDMIYAEEDITDDDGNVIGNCYTETCADCNYALVSHVWREYTTSCVFEYNATISINIGDVCILHIQNSYDDEEHDYEYIYELQGEICADGVLCTATCIDCGTQNTYKNYGHINEYKNIDFSEYNTCGGYVEVYACKICGNVRYIEYCDLECNMNCIEEDIADDDGNVIGICTTYTCEDCGFVRIVRSWREYETTCQYVNYTTESFVMGEECIVEAQSSSYYESHCTEVEFVLNGTSCFSGYSVIEKCKDCDYSNTYSYSSRDSHPIYTVLNLDSNGYACCEEHNAYIDMCPCGIYFDLSFNSSSFDYDEEQNLYACADCGLSIAYQEDESEIGCSLTITRNLQICLGDEEIYRYEKANTFANHSFVFTGYDNTDGNTVISAVCQKCGEERSNVSQLAELEKHGDQYYYDFTVTPEETATYTITSASDRDTYVTLYKLTSNGSLSALASNDDSGYDGNFKLTYELTAGETYVYRIRFYSSSNSGSIAFVFGNAQDMELNGVCQHSNTIGFAVLPDGATSCEDGVMYGSVYTGCGCINYVYTSTSHNTVLMESIDHEQYGGCYGYLKHYSCACGKEQYVNFSHYTYNHTSNRYEDEDGRLIHVDTYTCSNCALRYSKSYYTVRDYENCIITYYYTVILSIGDTLIDEFKYTDVETEHDYEITAELKNGEGSSCEDGVTITYTCKVCGDSYSNTYTYHEQIPSLTIELSDLGCVCGGYAVVYSCACGYSNYVDLEHCLCEFDSSWCSLWIEDENLVTDSQYTTHGNTSFGYSSYVDTCAVTDPSCAYKIRYAYYYLKAEDECKVYSYVTWQFGYDETTGTCAYEITFKTGGSYTYHDYVVAETENGTFSECADCGSTYRYSEYYDADGYLLKTERIMQNTLDNGENKYREEVYEYAYDNGSRYTIHKLTKIIRADGSEYINEYGYVRYHGYTYDEYYYYKSGDYWYRYDYTYTFDGECLRTTVYTNSNEESSTSVANCCRMNRTETLLSPTCSQDGLAQDTCVICGRQGEVYTTSHNGHSWQKVTDDWYYCYYCGLENANGATGSILMEDLTGKYGNGENYVVGYYAGTNVTFTHYVSLVLANGKDIILDGITLTQPEDLRAFVFSKTEVAEKAAALGYAAGEYAVCFTFVPYGDDGSLDYALTLTEEDEVGTIEDDISFTTYVAAGEHVSFTVAPAEDSVWTFTSNAYNDTYGYLYDADGKQLTYDDDDGEGNNFLMTYTLKAGETYTFTVRWYSSDREGYMHLQCSSEPVTE